MTRGWGRFVLAAALFAVGAAQAQQPVQRPAISQQEALQLAAEGGFTMRGTQAINACGRPTQPRFAFVDLNGDGRPEAIAADVDVACYGGTGESFAVLWREPSGRWSKVGAGRGRLMLLQTRTAGWRDYSLEGPGCQRVWNYDASRRGYYSLKPCPGEGGPRPAATPAPSPSPPGGADKTAALRAAGFTPTRGRYLACDKSQELEVEIRDLNGDGRPDAIITDSGLECFGNAGTGYVLVTREVSGAWRKLFENQGIPDFQTTRGAGGWPDIVNGGPGFCFPVLRWNGTDYARIRWKAEQPGACAGRR